MVVIYLYKLVEYLCGVGDLCKFAGHLCRVVVYLYTWFVTSVELFGTSVWWLGTWWLGISRSEASVEWW